jgi:lipopolysaccharide biosynthesis glycosyltransferase
MIRIFIGYDPHEAVAYNVLSHSVHTRASKPVEIAPLMLSQLHEVFTRDAHPLQSTEFSFSRFLVPYLSEYAGWSLFCDCDMLMLDDISNLWDARDERFAVQVVKHEHKPKETKKFLDKPQSQYEKKNWSSVILFNNAKCSALTPEYVNTATGLELHQFKWLRDDSLIGELPHRWNHLVDYDPTVPASDVSLIHFTEGGPYFEDYKTCSYADLWFAERDRMLFAG